MTLPESKWSIDNPGPPPILTPTDSLKARIERGAAQAVAKIKAKNVRKPLTQEERKLQAEDLRKQADFLERQQ